MNPSFGTKELIKCLIHLDFKEQPNSGTSHVKYKSPMTPTDLNIRPFIIVQLGRKVYDKHTQSRYIRQILRLGFDKVSVLNALDN